MLDPMSPLCWNKWDEAIQVYVVRMYVYSIAVYDVDVAKSQSMAWYISNNHSAYCKHAHALFTFFEFVMQTCILQERMKKLQQLREEQLGQEFTEIVTVW